MNDSRHVAVIGAGPAGLMAADALSRAGTQVTVFERMPSPARKFLLAGRGGLNLTHSEPFERFMTRYGTASSHLREAIAAFTPDDLRKFSLDLGQETFVGSSGRIFPKAFKTSPLLRAWLRRLDASGVQFRMRHRWVGWDADRLSFMTPEGAAVFEASAVVLALGGASWPQLGSDGAWTGTLEAVGVPSARLRPANCGFTVAWSERFREGQAGQPLKGLALTFDGVTVRGEAMITSHGIEGGGIYALSSALREAVESSGAAMLNLALRPDIAEDELTRRLGVPRGKRSLSNHLRRALHLSATEVALLNEVAIAEGSPLGALSAEALANLINRLPVRLTGVAPISRAISSAGGIPFESIDEHFMLLKRPGVFAAGEMLDWEAPTGGYLLQASFATGAAAGRGVLAWLAQDRS